MHMHICTHGGSFCWELLGGCASTMDVLSQKKKIVHSIQQQYFRGTVQKIAYSGNISK